MLFFPMPFEKYALLVNLVTISLVVQLKLTKSLKQPHSLYILHVNALECSHQMIFPTKHILVILPFKEFWLQKYNQSLYNKHIGRINQAPIGSLLAGYPSFPIQTKSPSRKSISNIAKGTCGRYQYIYNEIQRMDYEGQLCGRPPLCCESLRTMSHHLSIADFDWGNIWTPLDF